MNHPLNTVTNDSGQCATRRAALKTLVLSLAGVTLAFCGTGIRLEAQTSTVCDPAGDAVSASGKSKPAVPPWLDIIRAEVTEDSPGEILCTLTLNAPIPVSPAWKNMDDGGQLWWGFRMVGDLATDFGVRNGCIKPAGQSVPGAYFLDLIWDVPTLSFQARLLDDTSCVASPVPFFFSDDQTEVTLVLATSLLINEQLIPDPNHFQFFAATLGWKANATGNTSYFDLDWAPDGDNGHVVPVNWSATSSTSYGCP
jgi:hypothetical protein